MPWYIAHAIEYTECLEGEQDSYDIFENMLLIQAATFEEAFEKARKLSQIPEDDEGYVTWDGGPLQTWNDRPARQVFAGIRKVIKCCDGDEMPSDGTEVSYSQLTVKNKVEIRKLVTDEALDLTYQSGGFNEWVE